MATRFSTRIRLAAAVTAVVLTSATYVSLRENAAPFLPATAHGEPVWSAETDIIGSDVSAHELGDVLYVGSELDLHEFHDLATGELLWSMDDLGEVWLSESAVVGVERAVDGVINAVRVRDPATGEERFSIERDEDVRIAKQGVLGETLILHTPTEYPEGEVVGIDLATGDETWSFDYEADRYDLIIPGDDGDVLRSAVRSKPVDVFLSHGDDEFTVRAVATGEVITDVSEADASYLEAAPVIAVGEVLVVPTRDVAECEFGVYVFDPLTGDGESRVTGNEPVAWATSCGGNRVRIYDGVLYGQSEDRSPNLLDLATGDVLWTADEPGDPFVFGDGVAVYRPVQDSPSDPSLRAVDIETGKTLWVRYGAYSAGAVVGGTLALTRIDYLVEAVDLRSGHGCWQYEDAAVSSTTDDLFVLSSPTAPVDFTATVDIHVMPVDGGVDS